MRTIAHQILTGRLIACFLGHEGQVWLVVRNAQQDHLERVLSEVQLTANAEVEVFPLAYHLIVQDGMLLSEN